MLAVAARWADATIRSETLKPYADATLDKVKWGGATWTSVSPVWGGPANPNNTNPTNNFETELLRVKDYYLPGRRTFLSLSLQVPFSFNRP